MWGDAPHIALLPFAEKPKGRFLDLPFRNFIITGRRPDFQRKNPLVPAGITDFLTFIYQLTAVLT